MFGLYLCVGTGMCLSQHYLAGVALLRSLGTIEVDSFWKVVERYCTRCVDVLAEYVGSCDGVDCDGCRLVKVCT